eukprot:gene4338-5065_t
MSSESLEQPHPPPPPPLPVAPAAAITFSAKDHVSPTPAPVASETLSLPSISTRAINSSTITENNSYEKDGSMHSAIQNSNISSSTPTVYHEFSTKTSIDEFVLHRRVSFLSLASRVLLSWGFGLCCQVILMLFNPRIPMQFIWGVLCVGCGMTAAFAVTWSSLLLKFNLTFLIVFSTMIYWVGTPIAWQILFNVKLYPPPIGVFTCIFPFEGASLVLLCLLIPRAIRAQKDHRKKVIAAFSSLIAPYLSFVSGLIYFRLFQYSDNIGRILLPPAYTVVMKFIQLGLDIICVRCAHSASNLLIIIGRIIASYYSFAVLSFIRNPNSVISIVFSKLALHIFMSLFMLFPRAERLVINSLPKSIVGWATRFERGVRQDPTPDPDGASSHPVENEFDKMVVEHGPQYSKLHSDATNLWFSMFSDLLAIVMCITVYSMGRFGPTREHYNNMFPFSEATTIAANDSFVTFLLYLGICFGALFIAYFLMWSVLNYFIKMLDLRKIMDLVSVNWFPLHHFYVSCINFMMGYVIVVVALMPDLFSIPGINFWSTGKISE